MFILVQVIMSDYPASVVLANIRRNADTAIPAYFGAKDRIKGHK